MVQVDANGIFEFNMTILNISIPYLMNVKVEKPNYSPIIFDYFVGGYPITSRVELGTYSFYTPDTLMHNVTGRVFEAFTNKTLTDDFTLTVY